MYANIIYVQSGETLDKAQFIFTERGSSATIDYLAQWDYGTESEHDIVEEIPHNKYEIRYAETKNGREYVLIEHPLYITLYRRVSI